ncbi:hypothetical protein AgCh_017964 [Apium graveolens]
MENFSSSKSQSTEYCSTAEPESGWTDYIGDKVADGTDSDDSLTSDARSSSPPPSGRFHCYNQHSDDEQVQDKLCAKFTSSVSKKMQLFKKQMVAGKSIKQPCNSVTNINKQASHDDNQEKEDDNDGDEQLMEYQQPYRTTVCSTTDAYNCRTQNP